MLAWGIFFISSNQGDAPTLKARNWSVQTKTPEETAGQVPNPSRQASPNTEVAEEGSKERLAWHNVEGISVSMDEEEGRHFKRVRTVSSDSRKMIAMLWVVVDVPRPDEEDVPLLVVGWHE